MTDQEYIRVFLTLALFGGPARPLYLQVKSFPNSLYEVLSEPHSLSGRFAVELRFFDRTSRS
jgi:hypothetical protein